MQRADGKVPHEISQSAPWLQWFTDYPYPWNSADASPLFVIAHADHWRATGDRAFLDESFEAILKAWRFTARTDTDGNGLVENTTSATAGSRAVTSIRRTRRSTSRGCGSRRAVLCAELAEVRGDGALAEEARLRAEQTRAALEKTYWLEGRGFYAFATLRRRDKVEADRGPERARRQARLEALAKGGLADEDTVMPSVPMWWGELDDTRAQSQLDHLGASALASDWGTRLLSQASELYDPLSYHHGSVWPLFTGWTAMAAYRYGRPWWATRRSWPTQTSARGPHWAT